MTTGLARLIAALLGMHLQHARREASQDLGRVVVGIVLVVLAVTLILLAVILGHIALVEHLASAWRLSAVGARLTVGAGDLIAAVPLLLVARLRLRKPILAETRELVRETVASLSAPPA
jgi:hypothetical protein